MTWTPLTRDELDEMLSESLALYDEEVRSDWESIRIEPAKWQWSPEGDLGGGFWAVATDEGQVLWYNDIEEGFNWSRYSQPGILDEYWCGDAAFVDILEHLALRRSRDAWKRLAETGVPAALSGPGRIVKRQSTYWDVESIRGVCARLHFRDKVEFGFADASYDQLSVEEEHPLLWDSADGLDPLYISGRPADAMKLVSALEEAVRDATCGWRGLRHYAPMEPTELLRGGYGMLGRVPRRIGEVLMEVLETAGVSATMPPGPQTGHRRKVLLLGRNYVIAEEFRIERRDGGAEG